MPELKQIERLFAKLINSESRTFPEYHQPIIAPEALGVYVIYSPNGRAVHVGRTPRAKGGIAQRLRNHLSGSSSFASHYLKGGGSQLRGKYTYRCIVVKDNRLRALLEAYAIGHLCPEHLGVSCLMA